MYGLGGPFFTRPSMVLEFCKNRGPSLSKVAVFVYANFGMPLESGSRGRAIP